MGATSRLGGPSGAMPVVRIIAVGSQGAFSGCNQPKNCEVCRGYGHPLCLCPILQKYSNVPNNNYCEFFTSTTHHMDKYQVLDALADWLDHSTFKINETTCSGRGGGMRAGREGGRGPIHSYNCDQEGPLTWDFPYQGDPGAHSAGSMAT